LRPQIGQESHRGASNRREEGKSRTKIKKNEKLDDFLTFSDERQRILTPFSDQILVFAAKLSSVRLGFVKMTRI
jgi:hypothetical protein